LPFSTTISIHKERGFEIKEGMGTNVVMQNKKTAQPQAQQEMSSSPSTRLTESGGWASGREPMTGAQASYLKTLCEQVREPGAFREGLSKSEATRRIDSLKERLRLGELPPHTD
jgi:hypothetical protein